MIQITPGAIVSGKSGKKFLVDRVEGDIIYSGEIKFLTSAVINVIPPRPSEFKLGDRVRYNGTEPNLQRQYAGELTIWAISKHDDGYTCLKPDGRVTSWIEPRDLVEQASKYDASTGSGIMGRKVQIGDSVRIVGGNVGTIALWHMTKRKAIIELPDGNLSDWIDVSRLEPIKGHFELAADDRPTSSDSLDVGNSWSFEMDDD